MTNVKEILRLYLTREYSQREIATSVHVSRNTVRICIGNYITKCLTPYDVEHSSNTELYKKLFQKDDKERYDNSYLQPNFEAILSELKKPHMTKKLLWREYIQSSNEQGLKYYSISRFNELLEEYAYSKNISISREREPGEVVELDWTGSSLPLKSPFSDETVHCHLFVAALPYSGYFYAEAFLDEKIKSWTEGIVNSLEFFNGVPKILKPDNCKTATIKADKYEPDLNQAMVELAEHYRVAVLPARVRKPKDKNVVESVAGFVSRNIIAALRNETFYTLESLNKEILKGVNDLNSWSFNKKEGNRIELFKQMEQGVLDPLPLIRFELFERKAVKVALDYHVQYEKCFYSVHPKYVGQELRLRASSSKVTIFTKTGEEVASHNRAFIKGQKVTNPEHIPEMHKEVLGWSGDKFRSEASSIGENTRKLIDKVLKSRKYEVQSYNTCRGILNLKNRYGKSLLEKVCAEAAESNITSYKNVKTLLDITASESIDNEEECEIIDPNNFFFTHAKKEN